MDGIEGLSEKVSSQQAGYMELPGATKHGNCQRVSVDGGVSTKLGCCNLFDWEDSQPKKFACGSCEYLKGQKE